MGKFKANGYVIFANEYKKKHGYQFYSYREFLEAMSPFWEQLSEKEKEMYKERAKAQNKRADLKRTNSSNSNREFHEKRIKLLTEQTARSEQIENFIYTLSDLAELDDKIFHFISISSYFEDHTDIYPAELAIAKYSLKNGIIDTLHIKISPGQLPVGALFGAREKASQTHKYLIPPKTGEDLDDRDDDGEKSFILILMEIVSFLDATNDELPMFFTEQSTLTNSRELQHAQRALVRIFEKGGEYDVASELKIYPIVDLFYHMNVVADSENDKFPSLNYAQDIFKRTEGIIQYSVKGCDYHEEVSSMFCCLAKVRCYGYIISKYCVNATKYPLLEGKHYPGGFQTTA